MDSPRTTEIAEMSLERWTEVAEQARTALVPLVIRKAFPEQAMTWTPRRFVEHWPDQEVYVTVDLPAHGVPYRESSDLHQRTMTVGDFVMLLESGNRCY